MAQVFEIKFNDLFCTISVPLCKDGDAEGFHYDDLELKVRDVFQIPLASRVVLMYTDGEDDVTMADDQDLRDACLMQKLNPLKLKVTSVPLQVGSEAKHESRSNTVEFNVEALLKGLFPESTVKAIEQVLIRYPPCLFTTVPAHVLPEALDTFLGTLAAAGNRENTTTLQRGHQVTSPVIAVHKYIECDHCYMCPIVGPRYKSTKKHDYDLCSNCFKKFGNAMDYRKLDRPAVTHSPTSAESFKAENDQCSLSSASRVNFTRGPYGWVLPDCVRTHSVKDSEGTSRSLDALFVKDVTILDGSKVEVGTTFSKIWRVKNCGMLPWPQHTRLVHTGGAMLSSTGIVTLKLPAGGLQCDREIDVCVELKAPDSTGQYVSNWRLMSPSGQVFGHSVWVLVEAVPLCSKSQTCETKESNIDEVLKESVIEEAEMDDSTGCEDGDRADSGSAEVGYKIARVLLKSDEQHGETDGFSVVERGDNGLVEVDQSLTGMEEFEFVDPLPQERTSGFKQNDVNIEPLQNILSEDDSLASADWDDMLKELEEMGFHDTRPDIKELLVKSKGNITRAVEELVELEKQMFGKIKAA